MFDIKNRQSCEEIAGKFSALEEFISKSHDFLKSEKDMETLDMRGMENSVADLCNSIASLAPNERNSYTERLRDLLANLSAFGIEMEKKIGMIKDIPVFHKASVAYKTADSRDNFGKRENSQ